MNPSNTEIRCVLLNRFRLGHNCAQTYHYLCDSYGKEVLSERQCRRWFKKFKEGHFEVTDDEGRGRKVTLNQDRLLEIISANPRQSTRELAIILGVCQRTACNGLKRAGLVQKRGTWVPHDLSAKNKIQRAKIAEILLARQNQDPFLDRVVTCDEKWVLYNNVSVGKQWLMPGQNPIPTPKAGLHPKKVLISVFWDCNGIIMFDLLPENQTIDASVYCEQLDRLAEKLASKRPSLVNRKGVIFHQDNARPHTAKSTIHKIENDLKWELLPHPPYSPDLAPSDFHLFRSMEHYLRNKKFENRSDLFSGLTQFFDSKATNFYKRGIFNLVNRWQRVIESDGNYII